MPAPIFTPSRYRVPLGPFDLFPTIQVRYTPSVRLTQQYIEVIDDGTNNKVRLTQQYVEVIDDGTNNKVRLTQQYAEAVTSGQNNLVRLTQQYIEVVRSFGDPPTRSGGGSPGNSNVWRKAKDDVWRAKRQAQLLTPSTTVTTGTTPSLPPSRPMITHCGRLMGWP